MIHAQPKNNSIAAVETKLTSLSLATESEHSFQGREKDVVREDRIRRGFM